MFGRQPPPPPPRAQAPRGPVSVLLRLCLGLVALALPVLAFWLATSLVLDRGASRGTAMLVGGGLVLGLPILWDLWAEARHRRKDPPPERLLSRADRVRMRILAVTLAFIAVSLFGANEAATHAIAERGDWFLDGAETPFARDLRGELGGVALRIRRTFGPLGGADEAGDEPGQLATPAPLEAVPPRTDLWPLPPIPHAAAMGLTDTRAKGIADVAAHIAARTPDLTDRVKALHDFAIVHLRLDVEGLFSPPPPESQTAERVFASRLATAEGYANLLVALGEAAGVRIIKLTGLTRRFSLEHEAFEHAWNAVDLDGQWRFIDAARNAGTLIGRELAPGYGTTWLFAPAEVMAWDYLPDDPAWASPGGPRDVDALLAGTALSGAAALFALSPRDLPSRLVASDRTWSATLDNPRGATLLATAWSPDDGSSATCAPPRSDKRLTLSCELGDATRWIILLHAAREPGAPFTPVGQLRVLHQGTL